MQGERRSETVVMGEVRSRVWPLNIRNNESKSKRLLHQASSPLFSAAFCSALLSIEPQRAALTL